MWGFKWYILAVAIAAGVVGYGLSLLQPTLYEAQGEVLLEDPSNMTVFSQEVGLSPDPKRHVTEQAQLIESLEVAQRASGILGGTPDWRDIQASISVIASSNSDAVAIYASQATPDDAVALVDAVKQAYASIVGEQIDTRVDSSTTALEEAKANLEIDLEAVATALDASIEAEEATGSDASDTESVGEQDSLIAGIVDAMGPAIARVGGDADLALQQELLLDRISGIDVRIQTLSVGDDLYGSGVKAYLEPPLPQTPTQPRPVRNAAIATVLGLIGAGAWAWWRAESTRLSDNESIGESSGATPP